MTINTNNYRTLSVDLGAQSYDISIGSDLLALVDQLCPIDFTGRKVFVLTDENVGCLYRDNLLSVFKERGAICHCLDIVGGESSKSFEEYERLSNEMLSHKVTRDSVLIALGGGVVGDLSGFLASTIVRGISYIQIPTTLLAQVDSAVGGKTAINTQYGKNLVGTFYQPKSVIVDLETLKTLPNREYKAGLAEVVKYGVMADPLFLKYLEDNTSALNEIDKNICQEIVFKSCSIKASVVNQDEKETTGSRALLNFGHTFGHALELLAGYNGDVLHGEAVSVGMVMASQLSCDLGMVEQKDVDRVTDILKSLMLPIRANDLGLNSIDVEKMYDLMLGDKKATKKGISFILLNDVGSACVVSEIPQEQVLLSTKKWL